MTSEDMSATEDITAMVQAAAPSKPTGLDNPREGGGGGGGLLPYIRYIGMCRPKGYGF